MRKLIISSVAMVALLFTFGASKSSGYDSYVYENLQRSRDALLTQRAGLERKREEYAQKLARIDQYQRQVDSSLKDVEDALRNIR